MTQHTAAIVIVVAMAAVKALRDYMKERDKKNETWIDPRRDSSY